MIVCTRCGHQNEDGDAFCGSCAGFLEWSGERVAEAAVEPEAAPGPGPDVHAGLIERVKDRIGLGDARTDEPNLGGSADLPAPPPAATGTSGQASGPPVPSTLPPARSAQSTAPTWTDPTRSTPPRGVLTPTTTARPLIGGSSGASPSLTPPPGPTTPSANPASGRQPAAVRPGPAVPRQPEAVKPTAVKARYTPQTKVAPSRVVNPGDLICGQCGEGNEPARRFCRRCGASLHQAHTFVLPWYRRLWRKLTTPRVRVAGERPRARRRAVGGGKRGWLSSWVTKVVVVAIIAFAVVANVGPWKPTIRQHLSRYYHDVAAVVHPTYNPVHPVSAGATSSAPGHGGGLAIDGLSNTSWQTGSGNGGTGQTLTIHLAPPTNVDKIGFLSGDQDTPQAYLTETRPEMLHLEFTPQTAKAGETPYVDDVSLKDTASFQTYTVNAKNVSEVSITIDSVYPSAHGTHAAIAEVELFQKS